MIYYHVPGCLHVTKVGDTVLWQSLRNVPSCGCIYGTYSLYNLQVDRRCKFTHQEFLTLYGRLNFAEEGHGLTRHSDYSCSGHKSIDISTITVRMTWGDGTNK